MFVHWGTASNFFASLLMPILLSGCWVKFDFDSREGCIKLDDRVICDSFDVHFERGDIHNIEAVPLDGFAFSHWKKAKLHLFGENTVALKRLNTSILKGDLPDVEFYMKPEFVPRCRADYSPVNDSEFPYLDCKGESLDIQYNFADLSDQTSIVHRVKVLFYVDLNAENVDQDNLRNFVDREIQIVNRALENSRVKIQIDVAGVLPIRLPLDGETRAVYYRDLMRDLAPPFDNMLEEMDKVGADLAHALIAYEYDGSSCGASWVGIVDYRQSLHSGTTACFSISHGEKYKYLLAHELGHNFGLAHSRDVGGSSRPTFDFGYGWANKQTGTIMSYSSPRLPRYSNGGEYVEIGNFSGGIGDEKTNAMKAMNKVRLDYARIFEERYSDNIANTKLLETDNREPISMHDEPKGPVRVRAFRNNLAIEHDWSALN